MPTFTADLLEQIDADVASLTADGAYDGQVVYDAVAVRYPEASVIVPLRMTAVAGETTASKRDSHLVAASAPQHLAGEAAALSRLLRVRTQRTPAWKSAAQCPRRCPCQVMRCITLEVDK